MRFLSIPATILIFCSLSLAGKDMQIADLVKKHLDSIGNEQARKSVKTRVVEGDTKFQLLNGAGAQEGKSVFVSEDEKMVSLLKLPNPSYHGERFVSDGKKTQIAQLKPGVWSNIGQFVMVHNEILKEGLWGGTLSTGWALAHLDGRHAKMKYEGLKKVNGRELQKVLYLPSMHSDLQIELYFEPDTFRHVMTVYSLTISPQLGGGEIHTAEQQETRYRLEERFSDFKAVDNLDLPHHWTVQYTAEESTTGSTGGGTFDAPGGAAATTISTQGIGTGHSPMIQFDSSVSAISHNVTVDPKNYEIK